MERKIPGYTKKICKYEPPDSVNWSLSGTEKKYFPGRSLAIDGIDNVIEFLEKLESGHIAEIDFLEMRACDQGCAGGASFVPVTDSLQWNDWNIGIKDCKS